MHYALQLLVFYITPFMVTFAYTMYGYVVLGQIFRDLRYDSPLLAITKILCAIIGVFVVVGIAMLPLILLPPKDFKWAMPLTTRYTSGIVIQLLLILVGIYGFGFYAYLIFSYVLLIKTVSYVDVLGVALLLYGFFFILHVGILLNNQVIKRLRAPREPARKEANKVPLLLEEDVAEDVEDTCSCAGCAEERRVANAREGNKAPLLQEAERTKIYNAPTEAR